MDTSGFYKVSDSGELFFAPNFVYASKFTLLRKDKDKYVYPQDGWKWFDSEESAKSGYKIDTRIADLEKIIDKCISISNEDRLTIRKEVTVLLSANQRLIEVEDA